MDRERVLADYDVLGRDEVRLQCKDGVVSGRFLGGWGQNFAFSTDQSLRGC